MHRTESEAIPVRTGGLRCTAISLDSVYDHSTLENSKSACCMLGLPCDLRLNKSYAVRSGSGSSGSPTPRILAVREVISRMVGARDKRSVLNLRPNVLSTSTPSAKMFTCIHGRQVVP